MYGSGWGPAGGLIVLVAIVFYLGILALMLWIGYLLMRTAVKNGILAADEARAAAGRREQQWIAEQEGRYGDGGGTGPVPGAPTWSGPPPTPVPPTPPNPPQHQDRDRPGSAPHGTPPPPAPPPPAAPSPDL